MNLAAARTPAGLTPAAAAESPWDVLVIGAGPAGTLAARQAAAAGARTLIVERKAFPRYKVCGACVNGGALAVLRAIGLGHVIEEAGGVPLERFNLRCGGQSAALPLAGGVSVSRSRFDSLLAQAAVDAGADFLTETQAVVAPDDVAPDDVAPDVRTAVDCRVDHGARPVEGRAVELTGPDGLRHRARARVVLAADGLGGSSLARVGQSRRVARASRVGIGGVIDRPTGSGFAAGAISMAVGECGYVGAVRTETGSLNIAAAVDPGFLRSHGRPAAAVAELLRGADLPVPDALADARWHGTVPLTGRPAAVAGRRLFVLGDAAGYVEPFTGEGIAWALESALAVSPLALRAVRRWDDGLVHRWAVIHRRRVRRRQWACRVIAAGLRHPGVVRPALGLLTSHPALATRVVRAVGGVSNQPSAEGVCR